jgi:hypothetical protein
MSVDIEPRKTGAYTGSANILDNHPPFHLRQLNSRIMDADAKFGAIETQLTWSSN